MVFLDYFKSGKYNISCKLLYLSRAEDQIKETGLENLYATHVYYRFCYN